MIRIKDLAPQVYFDRSRDFQLIGKIYEVVFNYLKTNIDTIRNNPLSKNIDQNLVDLISLTLGFKQQHQYSIEQLLKLCSIFQLLLKNKGNIQSISYLLNMICNVENSDEGFELNFNIDDPYQLDIIMPTYIENLSLVYDVLDYILPAGITINLAKQTLLLNKADTEVTPISTVWCQTRSEDTAGMIPVWDSSNPEANPSPSDIADFRNDNATIKRFKIQRDQTN